MFRDSVELSDEAYIFCQNSNSKGILSTLLWISWNIATTLSFNWRLSVFSMLRIGIETGEPSISWNEEDRKN